MSGSSPYDTGPDSPDRIYNAAVRLAPLLLLVAACRPPAPPPSPPSASPAPEPITIAFWNVENLFDATDDPGDGDDEYLPARGWSAARYHRKLDHLAEVIAAMAPHAIGLCEVENRRAIEDLLARPALKDLGFAVVHRDSPDSRGIDTALLLRAPLSAGPVRHHRIEGLATREILEVECLDGSRRLHLLVNHWPSRRGESEGIDTVARRAAAARTLRAAVDRLGTADVLCMGDLNDEPTDDSVAKILGHRNLMTGLKDGTIQYRRKFQIFDHFVAGEGLMGAPGFSLQPGSVEIFATGAMKGEAGGPKPFRRTSQGWVEGYSDHFPIRLLLNRL